MRTAPGIGDGHRAATWRRSRCAAKRSTIAPTSSASAPCSTRCSPASAPSRGDTSVETMNAILKSDPPEIDPTSTKIPPGLDRIVRHCLEKNPADRFQSARDLTFALGALSGSGIGLSPAWRSEQRGAEPPGCGPSPRLRCWRPHRLAILQRDRHHQHDAAHGLCHSYVGEVTHLALSPDGSMLAYVSPDERHGRRRHLCAACRLDCRDSTGRHPDRQLSLLVAGREVHRLLRQRQAEEDSRLGRHRRKSSPRRKAGAAAAGAGRTSSCSRPAQPARCGE